ncbi:hypothetical protein L2Y96_14545 [Luteibacter aegosomaticola]|jgi:hypothetical protein|nr:hypothetical protein [Luteibacter aegosomaticola]UPG88634.1 hypothetical protein L2Y96_14545 [Luteibacter aegosomaticola]
MGQDLPRFVHFEAESYAVDYPASGQVKPATPKVEQLTDVELNAVTGD